MPAEPQLPEKFRIVRLIGRGGMGTVYEVEQTYTKARLAVKVLNDASEGDTTRERFLREARLATSLASDHVVRVFDVDMTPDDEPYMVMELLDGEDLERRTFGGRAAPREVGAWIYDASLALQDAHEAGIVHRDVKPSNLFLVQKSNGPARVKVLDFGVGKRWDPEVTALTEAGTLVGTIPYMAPEYVKGAEADALTDQWALAVTAYRLATGTMPFSGATHERLATAICVDRPRPPEAIAPDIPPAMSQVILRALSKKPGDRFPSVAAFGRALSDAADESVERPLLRDAKPTRPLLLLGAATASALVAVGILVSTRYANPKSEPPASSPTIVRTVEVPTLERRAIEHRSLDLRPLPARTAPSPSPQSSPASSTPSRSPNSLPSAVPSRTAAPPWHL